MINQVLQRMTFITRVFLLRLPYIIFSFSKLPTLFSSRIASFFCTIYKFEAVEYRYTQEHNLILLRWRNFRNCFFIVSCIVSNFRVLNMVSAYSDKWRHGLKGRGSRNSWQQYKGLSNKKRDNVDGGQKCTKLRDVIYGRPHREELKVQSVSPIQASYSNSLQHLHHTQHIKDEGNWQIKRNMTAQTYMLRAEHFCTMDQA